MIIRQARPEERERLITLALQIHVPPPYSVRVDAPTRDSIGRLVDVLLFGLGEFGAIFVAQDADGQVYGGLAIADVPNLINGHRYADAACWWVDPDRRGGSAGPKLLSAAEHWAMGRGLKSIKMVAPRMMPTLGRFYEVVGYVALETAYVKVLA